MSNILIEKIKKSEGFVSTVYKDHLGYDTLGIGTRMPITESEAELLLTFRLNQKISELLDKKPIVLTLSQDRQEVVFELAYQLGVSGLLKFVMMWKAIESRDFAAAAAEILDSRYATQTPARAEAHAKIMGGIYIS